MIKVLWEFSLTKKEDIQMMQSGTTGEYYRGMDALATSPSTLGQDSLHSRSHNLAPLSYNSSSAEMRDVLFSLMDKYFRRRTK